MEKEIVHSGGRRRRYSGEEQRLAIALYEESGLGVEEFCESEGLAVRNFERWLVGRRGEETARFVEVEGGGVLAGGEKAERSYRLGFEGGGWLEITGEFEEAEVRVLAGIVREAGGGVASSC
jgi:hypothetical protein